MLICSLSKGTNGHAGQLTLEDQTLVFRTLIETIFTQISQMNNNTTPHLMLPVNRIDLRLRKKNKNFRVGLKQDHKTN